MDETAGRGSLIGQRVSNYQIVAKLGAGGMGVVYKAIDLKLDRAVALKFLPLQAGESKDKDRLLREARAASALDHINIGTIYGIEETADEQLFIVMAYYEGETLLERIRKGPLAPQAAIALTLQAAQGLAQAHAKAIIHRDIKPSNLILTPQGVVKIVDFGLAKLAGGESLTETGSTVGTAAYMSPEQALGREIDSRTDIWSLGVVFYQMLTGVLPFRGAHVPSVLYAIVHEAPIPMQGAPAELEQVVSRFLAKDPADRYQSMQEVLHDLRALSGAHDLDTVTMIRQDSRPPTTRREMEAPRRRLWLMVGAGSAIAVLLVALAAWLLWPARWTATRPAEKHIAVLPFSNVGNDTGNQALVDGLMETLTSRLSDLQGGAASLWVVPASEVRRRKVTDATTAHREFGATLVVTGSVQRDSHGVRLTVALVDAANPRQLGSAVLDDRSGNFAALQDAAVAKLAVLMDVHSTSQRAAKQAAAPAAYESYLKGLGYLQRYDKTGNLDAAIRLFEEALGRDSQFALAYAGLGEAWRTKYEVTRDAAAIPQATGYCNRAIALDAQLAPAYITLGRIHDAANQHELAVLEFQHALELEPRNADATQGIARAYESLGRVREAEDLFRKAAALRPDYWEGFNRLGSFYYRQRRYEDAARQFQRVLELTPDNVAGCTNLAVMYMELRKWPEAQSLLQRAIQLAPNSASYSNLGMVYLEEDRYADAAGSFEKALGLNDKDYRLWSNLGTAQAYAGLEAKARIAFARAATIAEAAAKLEPQDAIVQANLGRIYAFLGRREDALLRLQAATARAPDDQQVSKRVAEAYERLGMRREAVEAARRALERGYTWDQLQHNFELRALLKEPGLKQK